MNRQASSATRSWESGTKTVALRQNRSAAHRVLRRILLGYVVSSVVVAIVALSLARSSAPFAGSTGDFGSAAFNDPADDWSAFNKGSGEQAPSWSGDEFLAAVTNAAGGQIVRMPGAQTYVEDDPVLAAVRGTNLLVVVTPPTPLGAVETTRVRDNTVQTAWANPHKIRLIMVHGQEVYLPYATGSDLIAGSTPNSGLPMREGMRTADATDSVVRIAQEELAYRSGNTDYTPPDPPGSNAFTVDDLALTGTRPPTPTELRPIETALDRGGLYVDPAITPAPTFGAGWSTVGQGKPVKVVLLGYAEPNSAPVDWTGALAQRYPGAVVLVMTGKWIESAGTDRQTMIDSIIQTYDLGGFSFAASAPAYGKILDWVTGIDAAAVASHAFARPLPNPPDTSFPRWIAYLLLGTALIIAAGFGVESWIDRRRSTARGSIRRHWRQAAVTGLTNTYLKLSMTPFLGPGGPERPLPVQRHLDAAYATLLQLHGAALDSGTEAQQQVRSAWTDLDAAATALDRAEVGPSASLSPELRNEPLLPAGPPRSIRIPGRLGWHWHWRWLVGLAVLGLAVLFEFSHLVSNTSPQTADVDLTQLQTSSVAEIDGPTHPEAVAIRGIVGNRALFVVQLGPDPDSDVDADDVADQIVRTYPDAIAFVLTDGDIKGASMGAHATTESYGQDDFIDDYYDTQNTAGGDVAVARQLALLYDRLGSTGSIHTAERNTYDPPSTPWVWIAVGLVLTTAAAAVSIRFATRRAVTDLADGRDEQAERTALQLRLAAFASRGLNAPPGATEADPAQFTRMQQLADRISTAKNDEFATLSKELDTLTASE